VTFTGFKDEDFDAYLEKKRTSNVYNLERLEVKQKLAGLGKMVGQSLTALDGSILAMEFSSEHPALWNNHRVDSQTLFFSRNEEARRHLDGIISRERSIASLVDEPSPQRNHIYLSLTIDHEGVEIALKLHADAAVDRDNLQRKCEDFFQREKILIAINALPEEFRVGLSGQDAQPANALDDASFVKLVADLPGQDHWFSLGTTLGRWDGRLSEPEFADLALTYFNALQPVMHLMAWSRDNDTLSIREAIKEKATKQKSKGLQKGDQVRVVHGLFSGKIGEVQEIDSKGSLRVVIGNVPVKLSSEDVIAK